MRHLAVTGLAAIAAVLGTWAAIPAASASIASATTASVTVASPAAALPHGALPGTRPGALPAPRPVAYPAGMAPAVVTPNNQFYDVSCIHASDCLAVGSNVTAYSGHGAPIAYVGNGTTWRATAVHLPTGASGGYLGSISCKPGRCIAVGAYRRSTSVYPFAAYWNGVAWSASPQPPAVSGAKFAGLEWVSCRSTVDCVAAGSYAPAANVNQSIALAETWNGRAWAAHRVPVPSSPYVYSNVDSVSCPVAGFCLLGGYYANSNGWFTQLAVRWDGVHFGQVTLPAITPATRWGTLVSGVSCLAATSCVIDGTESEQLSSTTYASSGFAEMLSAGTWTKALIPWPHGQQSELVAVACTSAAFCVGAGGTGPFTNSETQGSAAIVTYANAAWTVKVFPAPAGQGSSFNAVQCLSATYCVAAGTEGRYASAASGHGLTAFYNGTSWRLVNAP